MIDLINQKLEGVTGAEAKTNRLREFLHLLILKSMFDSGQFEHLSFVGGTALRVLFGLPRFSEDLDFCLTEKRGYSFEKLSDKVLYDIHNSGLSAESSGKSLNVVNICMIKFPGLLRKTGLSRMEEQRLSIKIEIDTNPPKGWKTALTPVSGTFMFGIRHFDLPSLFAAKIHACLFRRYAKGRDFYDLVWYLGKKISPNFVLLNNAAMQTEKKDPGINSGNLGAFLSERVKKLNFTAVRKDVERFIEDKNTLRLLEQESLLEIVNNADFKPMKM